MYKNKLLQRAYKTNRQILSSIEKSSEKNGVDPEIIFSIILIESVSRGNVLVKSIEKIAGVLFPTILIRLDVSLGIGQIRISTARNLCNLTNNKQIIKMLLDFESNISLVSKLVGIYIEDCKMDKDPVKSIVKMYTTGNKNTVDNVQITVYYMLLAWSISNRTFHKVFG
ncbi:lytic murein transglycosylase [Bacillus paranthracis]|nr:lytic murein transglycosylase [Bacillus paranthracis]